MYKAMIKKSKNKKGFTLVELIVVMAILAILAAILIPSVSGMINRSNIAVDNASGRSLYSAGAMMLAAYETVPSPASSATSFTATGNTKIESTTFPTDTQGVLMDFLGTWPDAKQSKATGDFELSFDDGKPVVELDGVGTYKPEKGLFE